MMFKYLHTEFFLRQMESYLSLKKMDNCEFSHLQPVFISSFNVGSINFQYSNLTSKSLTLTGAITHPYGLKFKPTSGVSATEYFKYP